MEAINLQLDDTTFEIFDVLEELYQEQNRLSQLMKQGFFGMSKARYSMGVKNVSADQIINANLSASLLININESSLQTDDDLDGCKKEGVDGKELFQLVENTEKKISKPDKEGSLPATPSESATGPRKRHTEKSSKSSPDSPVSKGGSTKSKDKDVSVLEEEDAGRVVTNSLFLFGILVPLTLRASQKDFTEAVKICVNIANLKHSLHTLQTKYRELLKRKKLASENKSILM